MLLLLLELGAGIGLPTLLDPRRDELLVVVGNPDGGGALISAPPPCW